MFSRLEKIWKTGTRKVLGVEVYLGEEAEYNYVIIRRNKNMLVMEEYFDSVYSLKQDMKKNLPVILCIDGKGILHKKVTVEAGSVNAENLHEIIPGFDKDDLYYQLYNDKSNDYQYVSFARKDIITNLIREFNAKKLYVTNIFLGPYSTILLKDIIAESEIVTNHYKIEFDNEVLIRRESSAISSTHTIDKEIIDGNSLTAYSAAISWFTSSQFFENNFEDILRGPTNEFKYWFFFQKILWIVLSVLFIMLFTNQLYYGHLQDKVGAESALTQKYSSSLDKIKKLEQEKNKKLNYFNTNGKFKNTRFSYYADRIAKYVPARMELKELEMSPLLTRIRQNKQIEFDENKIIIQGTSNAGELKSFVDDLQKEAWVQEADIATYKVEPSTSKVDFEIDILIRDK